MQTFLIQWTLTTTMFLKFIRRSPEHSTTRPGPTGKVHEIVSNLTWTWRKYHCRRVPEILQVRDTHRRWDDAWVDVDCWCFPSLQKPSQPKTKTKIDLRPLSSLARKSEIPRKQRKSLLLEITTCERTQCVANRHFLQSSFRKTFLPEVRFIGKICENTQSEEVFQMPTDIMDKMGPISAKEDQHYVQIFIAVNFWCGLSRGWLCYKRRWGALCPSGFRLPMF